jgi:hypothetical protein
VEFRYQSVERVERQTNKTRCIERREAASSSPDLHAGRVTALLPARLCSRPFNFGRVHMVAQ